MSIVDSPTKTPESTSNGKAKTAAVDNLTRQNVELIRQLEEAAKRERKRADLVAESIARFCGSMTFVWVHVVWFGGWILANLVPGVRHIDPFPFTFLTLVVSLEAIFLSTFILISQNHDTKISERRNHLDLQINLLSEQENTRMITMLQAIAAKVGAEVQQDPHLKALSENVEPQKLVQQIAARENDT
ncbi:MAG TPA: DUF1003 domain-containing protein [Pyrinomonadaceae bacterium]|jgi:uncharacterized membrane protein|nr:DUF1003 domain-containing protein [Pyrinomonadaceae bacterium]